MINIAICDDERTEITYLASLVRKWAAARSVIVRLSDYESAESFLFASEDKKSVDVLLLDIQMKGMDGVNLARQIRRDDEIVQIIFITGYPDFIAEGYDVSALHYLIKPVREEKLFNVLDKAFAKTATTELALLIDTGSESTRILQKDIIYIEALWPAVKIITANETYETKATFAEIVSQLETAAFTHCHRSYIAGLRYVKRLTRTELILDGNRIIPLSRRLYHAVHQAFVNFYKKV